MKHLQPYYYIIVLAAIFLVAGMITFALQLFPSTSNDTVAVDPQTRDGESVLYDLWFTSAVIHDLSVDHRLTGILYSTDNNTVTLLDHDRKLLWTKSFSSTPLQAKLSSCGSYIAVGTRGGRLFFTSIDQQYWWDKEGDSINLVAISPNGSLIAVNRIDPSSEQHWLELYNKSGEKLWSIETGPILNLHISSEYLEQGTVSYTYLDHETPGIAVLDLDGNEKWHAANQHLAAVSRFGSRMAVVKENNLIVYDFLGYTLWETIIPFDIKTIKFNPQNYNRLLVYGRREGTGDNLYYYDFAAGLLWSKLIVDGSLFAFTADGQHIVTSSWRHYREDYTHMLLLDQDGTEMASTEVAMRIEKLLITGHPLKVLVCSEQGYIDLISLELLLADLGNGNNETQLYHPVSTALKADETRIKLFFVDQNDRLISVTRSISLTENPLRASLEELVRGPVRGSALYRTIPDKDAVFDMRFIPEEGTLYLEIPPGIIVSAETAPGMTALDSIIYTLSSFPEVKEIFLTTEGKLIDEIGNGKFMEQPILPYRWEYPIYIPVSSGNRYYLTVREASIDQSVEHYLKDLLIETIDEWLHLLFVPSDLSLVEVSESADLIQVNMSESFKELFLETEDRNDILQAALVLDSLFLTVFENSRTQRVEILVEGSKWVPPVGYPSLSRFSRQPFFINPEQ